MFCYHGSSTTLKFLTVVVEVYMFNGYFWVSEEVIYMPVSDIVFATAVFNMPIKPRVKTVEGRADVNILALGEL
jgi:hypothetical protein